MVADQEVFILDFLFIFLLTLFKGSSFFLVSLLESGLETFGPWLILAAYRLNTSFSRLMGFL